MEKIYIEYKNFNGIGFYENHQAYIYETHTNSILKVHPVVLEIIDDTFKLDDAAVLNKYKHELPPNDIEEALEGIKNLKEQNVLSDFKIPSMSLSAKKETLEKVKDKILGNMTQLIFNVTEACNLRCRYCIYSGTYKERRNHNKDNEISWETAEKAIDYFLSNSDKSAARYVTFYGGEPFLRFDFIKKAIEYISGKDPDLHFSITSNGTVINREIIDFLSKHNAKLTISLDGPERIHDRNRLFVNQSGTHQTVSQAIELIKNEFPEFYAERLRFNAVLTPHENNLSLIDYFSSKNFSFLKDETKLNIGLVNPEENSYIEDCGYYEFLKQYMNNMRELYRDRHTQKGELQEIHAARCLLDRRIKQIHFRSHKRLSEYTFYWPNGICIPGMRSLFVSADGAYYPCEKLYDYQDMNIGRVDSGIDVEKIAGYIDEYSSVMISDCQKCWAFRLCSECFLSIRENKTFKLKKRRKYCANQKRGAVLALKLYISILQKNEKAFAYLENEDETNQYIGYMLDE